MEQISDPKVAFALLRPACVLLTKEQTVANVEQLSAQLRCVDDSALQQLQEYVLFPLRFVLRTPGPKRRSLVQAALEGMAYVLASTCVRSWDVLRELFSELCLCLCSPGDPGKPAPGSDELKAAALRGLDALLHAAYGDILFQLYAPAMLPGLGAAVSLLLALGEQEGSREVRTAALKCLQALLLRCDCPEDHVTASRDEERLLGGTFASFLPGITLALSRVAAADVRQGHAVTVRAIRVWHQTVGLVMADEQLSDPEAREEPSGEELGRVGELVVRRSPAWAKDTSGKLGVLLRKIISCAPAHQHWRVRLEVASLADHLLSTCRRSLGDCLGPLLEALVTMVTDESPAVRDRCEAALESAARRNRDEGGRALEDVLSENLHSLATSLPRLMRTSDDQRKLSVLGAFSGYLRILGPGVTAVLSSAAHLQRVSKALMQVLELDVTDVRIVEERGSSNPVGDGTGPRETRTQKKHFLYFTDEKIFSALQQICRLLGYYGDLYLLVDHFMDLYRESSVYRKQAALVLNEIITGAAGLGVTVTQERSPRSQDDLKAAATSIIEEYISLSNWHLVTVCEQSDKGEEGRFSKTRVLSITDRVEGEGSQLPTEAKGSTIHQLNSNIWQLCIQLEGMGAMALALGADFQPLLMTALYPVLEKAGDETLLVSQAALSAAWDFCRACGYATLRELIARNSDYLLNDVSLNLRRLALHPHAPRVLAVMFCHSDAGLLPLVRDVVQDVLAALDQSHDERAPVFCAVLHSLMNAIVRWFPGEPPGSAGAKRVGSNHEDPLDVRQFLLDYRRQKELAEGIVGDEPDEDETDVPAPAPESDVDMTGPDVKAELPSHIAISKDVMERCIHLLAHPSVRLRLKVLDVLELCLLVLRAQESELLPMAHRCWPALLQRLTNDDPLAVLRAFRVLCTLGETCGDFLRRRVSKEVLPKLASSLLKQAPVSAKAGPIYTHTLAYKLQLAVLEGLGALCLRLDLADTDLESVSEACLPYLSCRQPYKLQEACLCVFQYLTQVDPDAMWFTLNELYCPRSYEPSHPDLSAVHLAGMGRSRNEYTDNILKLLEEIR
ncbi:hypothetical protein MATL_G00103550 [Megalops atlanticus]|uniref:TELO2-interacting protein 1 n=1 Tax=Megalops atlanticus TaxID=7932 RepID=A0A9D3TBY3_MEGAT|nr:hypothetical protein MATL_G00103550 [Megalops atlanticus]